MLSKQLMDYLKTTSDGVTTSETLQIRHFGSLTAEAAALAASAVVCPVAEFVRIRATGADRAKFLHNFCTNNISSLAAGTGCEAFFTDVKAKVLAHGWVLAGKTCHELWMLPGDEQTILQHLNRYIITEDVTIEAVPAAWQTLVVCGPTTVEVLASAGICSAQPAMNSWTAVDAASVYLTTWNGRPMAVITADDDSAVTVWQKLTASGATPAGEIIFEHQRILEGFPRVGIDVTSDNLAPEADRNAVAISYTKGCYLGQEPIARLDAMGHVNRKLYCATVQSANADVAADNLPDIRSVSSATENDQPALVMLNVRSATAAEPVHAKLPDGRVVTLNLS